MAWYKGMAGPLVIIWVVAFIILFSHYYPGTVMDSISSTLYNWGIIAGSVIIWVGLINVCYYAYRDLKRKAPGRWYFAAFQLLIIILILASGFGQGETSYQPGANTIINWLFNNVYQIGAMTVSAMSGLYCVTATYRAFRARSAEAALFIIAGIFVMLRNAPIGGVIWAGFPIIGEWVVSTIYDGIIKTLYVCMAIGILAYVIRYYMGKEKAALGVLE